ncbi:MULTISPECIES: helix-turn-helix domain-containing protein [Christensenella]|mgnify:CR=1 FL=1|uniref:Transcriptional regulator, XRE family n=1 Tax=Christensenella hongkongensis TaxID=270498 RepID=A0A0M2NI52_9FIRM|nr:MULTISPECIES: helix-turn-helix transcriptional regulator [Christensenella]KKI51848.1 Transcriptional regulator, XRE family [Christensenella hongkongensis]TCW25515.1 DNA-binding XRE family transcriptional regulator [Christensenella hongkongensis]
MDFDYISERIARLRMKKDVSQREMSLELGQSIGYINRIENKKALPSIPMLHYICEYFGITLKDFFDDGIEYPVLLNELIEEEKDLDEQNILTLLSLAKQLNARKSKK